MSQQDNIAKYIKLNFGVASFRRVRDLERETKRLAAFKNHLVFNLRCKKEVVLPKDLRIPTPVHTPRSRRLMERTGRILLGERIGQCCMTIKRTERDISSIQEFLQGNLPDDIFEHVLNLNKKVQEREYLRCKERQKLKFEKLRPVSDFHNNCPFVNNLSSVDLSETELGVLNLGSKFAIASKSIPAIDIVAGVESGVSKIEETRREIVRAKIANLLVTCKPPCRNITKEEATALRSLKQRDSVLFLPSDKGGGLVVIDKIDYQNKVQDLLSDEKTYRKLESYSTPAVNERLVKLLKRLRADGRLTQKMYESLYPTTNLLPRFYGLPKTHKENVPLRPIIAGAGTSTNTVSSFVARIISPLVGQSEGHLKNSSEFHKFVSTVRLEEDELLVSFDVTALFTSVPTDRIMDIVRSRLENDSTLAERTPLNVEEICELLGFCLNTTYFTYKGEVYQQVFGAAMGSPVSAIVADVFMEDFEVRALQSYERSVHFWKRFIDDTCVALKVTDVTSFYDHLNCLEPSIRFTMELETNGCLPFLDLQLVRKEDGTVSTTVFRKPTATGQYLNFRSSHSIEIKRSIVKLLMRRACAFCSTDSDREREFGKIELDLRRCEYPLSFIKKCKREVLNPCPTNEKEECKGFITIPFVNGVSQAVRRVLRREGIRVAFATHNTIRNSIVKPKDKVEDMDLDGVVYRVPCAECPSAYVGQTKRQLKTRISEHKSSFTSCVTGVSAVAEHALDNTHEVDWKGIRILGREKKLNIRMIKEAIHIKLEANAMNRQHEDLRTLSFAWRPVLDTLKLKRL